MHNQRRERRVSHAYQLHDLITFSRLRGTSLVILFDRRLEQFLLLLQKLFLSEPALIHLARFLLSCLYPRHAIQAYMLADPHFPRRAI